jgi:sugar phosphate isomerase/epimerase
MNMSESPADAPMENRSGNIQDFGMDTISLAGTLPAKLSAVRSAGFSQVMVSARDVVGHPEGLDAAVAAVRGSGLRVTGFQALRDFEGLAGQLHEYKIDVAKAMLDMCRAVGSNVLLVCSSTSTHATDDPEVLARDLGKLAMLALPLGIRIAYEGVSSGRTINDFTKAWDAICIADAPNLGIAINSLHAAATDTALDDLDLLSPEKIFLVQLSDFLWPDVRTVEERGATPRHFRVFPGEGVQGAALAELVTRLDGIGYRGDYSFEVFNDDYAQMPPTVVAERARRAAVWLAEGVLRRAVPLPNRIRIRAAT